MKTKFVPLGSLLVTSILLGACSIKKSATTTQHPNVLFIMCDDLNDYQGVFGGHPQAQTPNIDKLAASGVQFVNAQSNCPVCQPSRNSLFTGVYPHDSKDFGWTPRTKQPVLKNNKPLMTIFKENGYYLLGSGKLLHKHEPGLWDEWGMNVKHNYGPFISNGEKLIAHPCVPAPYSEIGPVDGSYGRLSTGSTSDRKNKGKETWVYGWDKKPFRYVNDENRDLLQDELHAQWAVKKLKELQESKSHQPFFMGIGFVRPHTPLYAPDKYFDMFPLDKINLEPWLGDDDVDTYLRNNIGSNKKGFRYYRTLVKSYNGDRELALKHFLQAYLACIAFVDEQIGVVLDALDKSKLSNNTIVVFTSDHGWQMGEKSYLFKNSPWEESARIPLIIRVPGNQYGGRVEQPVSLIDIYPTLADCCSLKGSNKVNEKGAALGGHTLLPLLEDPFNGKWDGPHGALTIVGNYGKNIPVEKQNYSYRTKNWRYIHYSDGFEELYNCSKDKYEWHNVADKKCYQEIKAALHSEMIDIIGVTF